MTINLHPIRILELIAALGTPGVIKPGMEAKVLEAVTAIAAGTAGIQMIETLARNAHLWDRWEAEDEAAAKATADAKSAALDADGYVAVRIAYKDKDRFKRHFPSAKWDANRRTWMVKAEEAERAKEWEV